MYHRRSSRSVTITKIVHLWSAGVAAVEAQNRIVSASCSYKTSYAGKVPKTVSYLSIVRMNIIVIMIMIRVCVSLYFFVVRREIPAGSLSSSLWRVTIIIVGIIYCTYACCSFGLRKRLRKIKQILKPRKEKIK